MTAVLLASVLGLLSALHVYWLFGGVTGAAAVIPHVDGRATFTPSRAATALVAAGLAGAAVVALVCGRIVAPPVAPSLFRGTGLGLGLVFLARAIGEFRLVGFSKRVRGTPFAAWDTWLYSPLCLALAAAFLVVAW